MLMIQNDDTTDDHLTGLSALIETPPPILDSGSQYIFTKQHQHEFVKYYNENKDEMTKTSQKIFCKEMEHVRTPATRNQGINRLL